MNQMLIHSKAIERSQTREKMKRKASKKENKALQLIKKVTTKTAEKFNIRQLTHVPDPLLLPDSADFEEGVGHQCTLL